LRLYPPVWIISRMAVADDEIDGYAIPAGSLVCISPYLLHRNPRTWDEPERFEPRRFADPNSDHALLAFSAGRRHCIDNFNLSAAAVDRYHALLSRLGRRAAPLV
jgi:cytochrome P450